MQDKELVDKSGIDGFLDYSDLDEKITSLALKTKLKAEHDKIAKLKAFDSSYFYSKSHSEDDGTQN